MARQSSFPLYDALLGGNLAAQLRAWRTDGLSYEAMSWELRTLSEAANVPPVGAGTVRRWTEQLDKEAVA